MSKTPEIDTRDFDFEEFGDAVDSAADQDRMTWLTEGGKRIAAIVPVEMAETAMAVTDGALVLPAEVIPADPGDTVRRVTLLVSVPPGRDADEIAAEIAGGAESAAQATGLPYAVWGAEQT